MAVRAVIENFNQREITRYLPVFLIFFVIGIAGGRAAGMVFQNRTPVEIDALVSRELGNSQRNLVVLIVDQIQNSDARLESIWLLITAPDTRQMILVPVFPVQTSWSGTLKEKFELIDNLQPGTAFLDHLTELILWDHYLLIDRDGINSILAATSQNKTGDSDSNLYQVHNSFGQLTLEEQTSLWGTICVELASMNNNDELAAYFHQIAQYITTDLPWHEKTLISWSGTGAEEQITCEVPTLDLVSH